MTKSCVHREKYLQHAKNSINARLLGLPPTKKAGVTPAFL
jgi:hypothetical protein